MDDPPQPPAATASNHAPVDERQALQQYLLGHIPLARAMALTVSQPQRAHNTRETLVLTAPLAPNINDKGTAFGGAIAALLTLTGWGVMWILGQRHRLTMDIVIRQSQVRYLRPATGPLTVICDFPETRQWQEFSTRLQQRGRARLTLEPALESGGHLASAMVAEYAGLANSARKPTDTES